MLTIPRPHDKMIVYITINKMNVFQAPLFLASFKSAKRDIVMSRDTPKF